MYENIFKSNKYFTIDFLKIPLTIETDQIIKKRKNEATK